MNADVIIVGGGLAGGLTALRLSLAHPKKKVLLLERGQTLGGNHTWSFHEADLQNPGLEDSTSPSVDRSRESLWLEPLISKTWEAYEVRFPKKSRTMPHRFHSIRSSDFHSGLMKIIGRGVRLECDVVRISANEIETSTGEILRAPLVIDASGIRPDQKTAKTFAGATCGWLKYIAFDLKLKKPHGISIPIVTDAKVPQMDGFRFFRALPWDDTRMQIRESFYSSTPDLNYERISRSITAYAERAGWQIESIDRTEDGHRPLPQYELSYDKASDKVVDFNGEDFTDESPVSISSGFGWFHSSTGETLPDAVRLAEYICDLPQLRTGPVRACLRDYRSDWTKRQNFYRLLNRLVFRAAEPSLRYQIIERFYSLRDDLIERYFAGTSTRADRPKILGAKPAVRPGRATKNWSDEKPQARSEDAVAV